MQTGNTCQKAILVVSFGTSYETTRKATIEAIENEIASAFPDYRVYRAWTSKMIIAKLKKRDHLCVDTVKEAMEHMISDGIKEVIVQPTHVTNGIEKNLQIFRMILHLYSWDMVPLIMPALFTQHWITLSKIRENLTISWVLWKAIQM